MQRYVYPVGKVSLLAGVPKYFVLHVNNEKSFLDIWERLGGGGYQEVVVLIKLERFTVHSQL